MKKIKKIENLTYEMVEELKSLGVEFEDTQMVWIRFVKEVLPVFGSEFENEWRINPKHNIGDLHETTSAPNFQEVLFKLPKQFNDGKNCYCLILDYATGVMYYYDAIKSVYPFNSRNSPSFSLDNPLTAAYELLKWVAVNHFNVIKEEENEQSK